MKLRPRPLPPFTTCCLATLRFLSLLALPVAAIVFATSRGA